MTVCSTGNVSDCVLDTTRKEKSLDSAEAFFMVLKRPDN
jgi:hypothetical protein